MKLAAEQPDLADVANRALKIVEPRFGLFPFRPSASTRLADLQDLRFVAMRALEQVGVSENDEFRQKAIALLVCGIDDGIGSLSDTDPSMRCRLELSAKKKLESALHSIELIRNEE